VDRAALCLLLASPATLPRARGRIAQLSF